LCLRSYKTDDGQLALAGNSGEHAKADAQSKRAGRRQRLIEHFQNFSIDLEYAKLLHVHLVEVPVNRCLNGLRADSHQTTLHALLLIMTSSQLALMAPLIESRNAQSSADSKSPACNIRNSEAAVLKTCRASSCFNIHLSLTAFFTIKLVPFGVFDTVQLAAALLLSLFLLSLLSYNICANPNTNTNNAFHCYYAGSCQHCVRICARIIVSGEVLSPR